MVQVKDTEFVIFDVETTGLSPANGDRIVEMAAIKVKNFEVCDQFHSLINPEREISYGAFMVNGISQEMVQDAPRARDILPDFLEFIRGACLVGHNIRFDLSFLYHEMALANLHMGEEFLSFDTIKMARTLIPGLPRYALQAVAYSLDIDIYQEHRALGDVILTFEVFKKLTEKAFEQDLGDFHQFAKAFSQSQSRSARSNA